MGSRDKQVDKLNPTIGQLLPQVADDFKVLFMLKCFHVQAAVIKITMTKIVARQCAPPQRIVAVVDCDEGGSRMQTTLRRNITHPEKKQMINGNFNVRARHGEEA